VPKCTICISPFREKIDIALASGASVRNVAKQFKVGVSSVHRHKADGHICKAIEEAKQAGVIAHGKSLDDRINEIYNMSIKAGKMALGEKVEDAKQQDPDLRSFGSCMSPAAKMAELLYEKDTAAKLQEEIDALREQMAKDQ
jgi:hypothetical protein